MALNIDSRYPIEAHAYGGEEGGLLGSQKMAQAYKSAGRSIRGILNLEMVGWQPEQKGTSTITVLDDPNTGMHDYMLEVVKEYIPTADVRSTTCGVSYLSQILSLPASYMLWNFVDDFLVWLFRSLFLVIVRLPGSLFGILRPQ
jgi:hypothetical protein